MENETAKKVIGYTLTPQVVPRLGGLFFSGFSYVAMFMAQTYRAANLLPAGHPYLNHANMGKFGIRHVIAEAGNRLEFKKENIDQIVVFIMLLIGMIILMAQFALLGLGVFVQSAHASGLIPDTFFEFYLVEDATHDVAFVILDRVFGIPEFFVDRGRNPTCVVTGVECFNLAGQSTREISPDTIIYTDYARGATTPLNFPWPYHEALRDMFEAYSIGLLLIAAFIFLYFVTAVVAETAQSGTPFGRRFNHVWAPLRLVAAIGLLVPLTYGLNSAQYILMFAAKWGSGFATNGWILFYDAALDGGGATRGTRGTLLGPVNTMVAQPNFPPVNTLLEFATVISTCRIAYERMYHEREDREPMEIDAWLVNSEDVALAPQRLMATDFAGAVQYFNGGDIIIRFGELRPAAAGSEHQTYDGGVSPYCGELTLQLTHAVGDLDITTGDNPGSDAVLELYYIILRDLWRDIISEDPLTAANCAYISDAEAQNRINLLQGTNYIVADPTVPTFVQNDAVRDAWAMGGDDGMIGCIGKNLANRYLPIFNDPNAPMPSSTLLELIRESYQDVTDSVIALGTIGQILSTDWDEEMQALGWGGAAVWYNRVARLNGTLIGAAYGMPTVKKYPQVMEDVRRKRAGADTDTPGNTRHQVYRGPDAPVTLTDDEDTQIGKTLYYAQTIWEDHYSAAKQGGNIYIDVINALFGTSGLFNIHNNADAQIHPLAQLTAIGRTIIDSSIRNLGYSAAAGLGGGIINLFGDHMAGRVAMTASSFLSQIAMLGITIGFVLYYIIPFLPFIYFFFAVGGWIKAIFEAMVGVPLWALAHIRIDGNGLPGDAALGGYQLILEIFLRPILIIFGFIASITIFSAQVQILHEIWPLVVSNAAGFDPVAAQGVVDPESTNQTGASRFLRGAVDKLFFTVIYAIIVYMLGMSSFKMIDLIPNHVLRWLGASVSTFGDQSGDPAQNLVRNSFVGSNMISNPLRGAVSGLQGTAKGTGAAVGEIFGRGS